MSDAKKNLSQWLADIEAGHPVEMELGLARVQCVAQRLNINSDAALVITVAGTNGKGSTVALLADSLRCTGKRVGAFTSPHFEHFNERICIDGEPVADELLCDAFERIAVAGAEISLTYFEYATLAAFLLFQEQHCDAWVIEIGLGGRLDASNIIDADVAVITSIDLDHQRWLGNTRELIGREKAGIFRPTSIAVCGDPDSPQSIIDYAAELACPLYLRNRDFFVEENPDVADSKTWRGVDVNRNQLESPLPVNDSLYSDNIATVMQVMALLPKQWQLDKQALSDSLAASRVTGRFQQDNIDGREVILDVAHNPAAAKVLAKRLTAMPKVGRVVALFAVMADKDIDGIIEATKDSIDAWFLADLPKSGGRGKPANELAHQIHEHGVHMISVSKNFKQAYRRAMSLINAGDRLVVFGSFYTVAELGAIIASDKQKQARRERA